MLDVNLAKMKMFRVKWSGTTVVVLRLSSDCLVRKTAKVRHMQWFLCQFWMKRYENCSSLDTEITGLCWPQMAITCSSGCVLRGRALSSTLLQGSGNKSLLVTGLPFGLSPISILVKLVT